ncbi:tRNA preQ1(34) S-adenosylmethionine ribosyltransferase-isomerase QueA [bacterium]|nr:tRNA preQ1(34) S-adenosylmethionine ribosyltransferase-isomerase QueA [bacterium]
MKLSEFDYELPEELIAQFPAQKRDYSKLLVLDKSSGERQHKHFYDIVDFFDENDVLVLNNTRVIPARLFAKKTTGANIEIFLLKEVKSQHWEVLLRPAKRVKVGDVLVISEDLSVELIEKYEDGKSLVKLLYQGNIFEILDKVGKIPLPPYIERKMTDDDFAKLDYERYQTVYAKNKGSVAAPTAGLHFTEEILEKLKNKGVQVCYVTLNVGLGTFKPVNAENIEDHKMDNEAFEVSEETAKIISEGMSAGKRIVAVGTTSTRTLETVFQKYGEIKAVKDSSEMFIYPGYEFKVVDALITNFHLPKSTLIMLVSALAGKENIFAAYKNAIENKYRFYSYGDCMFIK